MKTKYQQEQFSAYERGGQQVLAINLEKILPETAPVRLASAQLEELDTSAVSTVTETWKKLAGTE